jgi:hypothetical protein
MHRPFPRCIKQVAVASHRIYDRSAIISDTQCSQHARQWQTGEKLAQALALFRVKVRFMGGCTTSGRRQRV